MPIKKTRDSQVFKLLGAPKGKPILSLDSSTFALHDRLMGHDFEMEIAEDLAAERGTQD